MPVVEIIQTLYVCSTTVAVMATIPQLRKLIIVKSSREFSLGSYMLWTCTQLTALMYMISIGNTLLIVTTSVWALYHMTMTSLIIYYRRPAAVMVAEPVVDINQPAATGVTTKS